MARQPRPGAVKTRLAAAVGPADACRIYEAMARDTWEGMRATAHDCFLSTDGDGAEWLRGGCGVLRQGSGSFGERLYAALADLRSRGYSAVAARSADVPHLAPERMAAAVHALSEGSIDVATCPTDDGGLALLAVDLRSATLLAHLPWETAALDDAISTLCAESGLRHIRQLPGMFDIDEARDLARLLQQPAEVLARCRETAAACRAIGFGGGAQA